MACRVSPSATALFILALACQAAAKPRDFAFTDEPVENVLADIANAGDFLAQVDPAVAKARVTIKLRQVEPLDAFFLVAKVYEYRVKRVPGQIAGQRSTYVVKYDPAAGLRGCGANSRTVQLKNAKSERVVEQIRTSLAPSIKVGLEHDARTNRILILGTAEAIQAALAIVNRLDIADGPSQSAPSESSSRSRHPKSDIGGLDLESI